MIKVTPQSFFEFPIFKKFPNIVQVISTKEFGDTKFYSNFEVNSNFKKILAKLNPNLDYIAFGQVHGSEIAIVKKEDVGKVLAGFDGGITNFKNVAMAVFVADCYPILAFEPKSQITGIAHAGWKGIKAGIVENLILGMKQVSAKPQNIILGVGPGICGCCYEVKEDVVSQLKFIKKQNGKFYADLETEIVSRLIKLGAKKDNIETAGVCVFENESFYSARHDKTQERFTALIGMKE